MADVDHSGRIVHPVDDPVVTDADSPEAAGAAQLLSTLRPGRRSKRIDRPSNSLPDRLWKRDELAFSGPREENAIVSHAGTA